MAFEKRIPEGRNVHRPSIGVFGRVARLTGKAAAWRLHRMLAGRLPEGPFRVLDIGTGPGSIPAHLSAFWPNADIVAMDICQEMLREAVRTNRRKGSPLRLLAGDGLNLPFAPDTFEVVICLFTLHHMDRPELFLREAARVLAPSGLLFVLDFRRDMARSRYACLNLLWRAAFLLSPGRNGFSHSVRSAWRPAEIEGLSPEEPRKRFMVSSTKTELIITNRQPEA